MTKRAAKVAQIACVLVATTTAALILAYCEIRTEETPKPEPLVVESMKDYQIDFLSEQYKALREEIILKLGQLGSLAQFAVVSSGAIWAWLLTKSKRHGFRVVTLVPAILVILLWSQYYANLTEVHRMSRHIILIEDQLSPAAIIGWERDTWGHVLLIDWWRRLFWPLLVGGNLIGSILLWFRFSDSSDSDGSSS